MKALISIFLQFLMSQLRYWLQWTFILMLVSLLIGSACAFFLCLLDAVTHFRWEHPWLLYFLPLGGLGIGLLYHHYGQSVEAGNNLILEQIHQPGGGLPKTMTPLVLFGTLLTHLLGGSAGREGTAVQMGGSIASAFSKRAGLNGLELKTLLMVGVAAGFGAVFGTPLAGAVFAIEVLAIGKLYYAHLWPCLIAAFIGDWACTLWGIHHTHYMIASAAPSFQTDNLFFAKVVLAALVFGWISKLFAELSHTLQYFFKWVMPVAYLRPVLGGLLVIGLVHALGTQAYLGLGVTAPSPDSISIVQAFSAEGVDPWGWWWKLLFTIITISTGFKGGEVTPLFFIGATLGNTLAWILGAPSDLFAALGFTAIFAGAANTPLACTLMGIELFGLEHAGYFAMACFIAYLASGHSGIYLSQKIASPKLLGSHVPDSITLRAARKRYSRLGAIICWIQTSLTGLIKR
jgi:H+/Cl- antiporter ClcA